MIEWARSSWETLRPFGTLGGVYLNFAGLEDDAGDADDAAVYGPGARRLAAVRAAYDPDALFEAAARRP